MTTEESRVLERLHHLWTRISRWRGTELTTTVIQSLKAVVAATVAWWLATTFFHSPQAFLAPWMGVLIVHATVRRTFARAAQTLVATTLGVLVAYGVGVVMPSGLGALVTVLLIGMAGSWLPHLHDEGITIATTALFVVVNAEMRQDVMLLERIGEVVLGLAVGLAVNLLVLPPLRDQQALHDVAAVRDRMGVLMQQMGEELLDSWDEERAEAWLLEIDELDDQLQHSNVQVDLATESRRFNPRAGKAAVRDSDDTDMPGAVLMRLHAAASNLRTIVSHVHESTHADSVWDDRFRQRWCRVMCEMGTLLQGGRGDARTVNELIDQLRDDMAEADLSELNWMTYGFLLTNLRAVADAVTVTELRLPDRFTLRSKVADTIR